MKFIEKVSCKIEECFIKHLFLSCAPFSALCTYFYKKGMINNVRESLGDVTTFASLLFAVLSLILTLLISLKNSTLADRIGVNISKLSKEIYNFLKRIILTSILVVIICLVINVLPNSISRIYKIIVCFIGFMAFWYMTFGSIYMLIFTTDLVIKDATKTNEDSIK
ncbi:hypothetical protein [Clostridium paraputrificum]|uniref:hypothetical protein n=1 Tax=Clostridium paraputrificum TaxID=29363 RepID=UPI003F62F705